MPQPRRRIQTEPGLRLRMAEQRRPGSPVTVYRDPEPLDQRMAVLDIGAAVTSENTDVSLPGKTGAGGRGEEEKENRLPGPGQAAVLVEVDTATGGSAGCPRCVDAPARGSRPRAQAEDGRVCVVFRGAVAHTSCCRFACELLKFVLYERQQLPAPYDQLLLLQEATAPAGRQGALRRPMKTSGLDGRRCQQTLRELKEVLQNLEVLFSLTLVPRVLLLLGGNVMAPKELFEIDLEALVLGEEAGSLGTAACLRQLFHTLFVADVLFKPQPRSLVATTVMVLGHRDCGVGWFRPRQDYTVPTRAKRQVIALSSDTHPPTPAQGEQRDWEDYIWFQAPVVIKGFCK
nr:PREDICTED: MAD2L1-binding protein [Lepisosteus oculatus]